MSEMEGVERMKPWEQHSSVISIRRFDYNAPSSLLDRSHSVFLLTCTIKIRNFLQYVQSIRNCSAESVGSLDAHATTKRRKICTEEIDKECVNSAESKITSNCCVEDGGELSKDTGVSSANTDTIVENVHALSLVKLTRSGLLLFALPGNNSIDTVDVLSQIIQSLESGSLKPPLLDEKELHEVVTELVGQFVNYDRNKLARPINVLGESCLALQFAVGYNRRGIEETQMKTQESTSSNCNPHSLLDRNKCFTVVAAGVKGVVSDTVVDLKSPELSVLVELLPLSRVTNGSMVVAVSVLPQNLVSAKPRLCINALLSDTNVGNRKS